MIVYYLNMSTSQTLGLTQYLLRRPGLSEGVPHLTIKAPPNGLASSMAPLKGIGVGKIASVVAGVGLLGAVAYSLRPQNINEAIGPWTRQLKNERSRNEAAQGVHI